MCIFGGIGSSWLMQGRRGWISPGKAFVLQWTEIGWWWNTMLHCSLTFVLCCCSLCPSVCVGWRSTYMTFLTCNFFAVSESPNHLNPTKYTGMCQSTLNQLLCSCQPVFVLVFVLVPWGRVLWDVLVHWFAPFLQLLQLPLFTTVRSSACSIHIHFLL